MAQCSYKTEIPKKIKLLMINSLDHIYNTLGVEIPEILQRSAKESVVMKKSDKYFKITTYHRVLNLHDNVLLHNYIIINETGLLHIVQEFQIHVFHRKKHDMLKIFIKES
jgi:hypothetical protein